MKKDDEQSPGQLSVFDLLNEGRPCDYSWQREIGRQQPFLEFYSQQFGACLWDRQHEWDTCDAWEKDRDILKED